MAIDTYADDIKKKIDPTQVEGKVEEVKTNLNKININGTQTTSATSGVSPTNATVVSQTPTGEFQTIVNKTKKDTSGKEVVNSYSLNTSELDTSKFEEQYNNADDFTKKIMDGYTGGYNKVQEMKAQRQKLNKLQLAVGASSAMSNTASEQNQIQQQAYANEISNQANQYPPNAKIQQDAQAQINSAYSKNLTEAVSTGIDSTLDARQDIMKMTKLQAGTALEGMQMVTQHNQFKKEMELKKQEFELQKQEFQLNVDKFEYQQDRDVILDSQWESEFNESKRQFEEEMKMEKEQFQKEFQQSQDQFNKTFQQNQDQFNKTWKQQQDQFNKTFQQNQDQFNKTYNQSEDRFEWQQTVDKNSMSNAEKEVELQEKANNI